MSPFLSILRSRGAVVLRMRGPLVLGHSARALREVAHRTIAGGHAVALDLTRVTQMDAHAIGVLAELYTAARDAGRSLVLAGASPRVSRLLHLSRLESVIPQVVGAAVRAGITTPPATQSARRSF